MWRNKPNDQTTKLIQLHKVIQDPQANRENIVNDYLDCLSTLSDVCDVYEISPNEEELTSVLAIHETLLRDKLIKTPLCFKSIYQFLNKLLKEPTTHRRQWLEHLSHLSIAPILLCSEDEPQDKLSDFWIKNVFALMQEQPDSAHWLPFVTAQLGHIYRAEQHWIEACLYYGFAIAKLQEDSTNDVFITQLTEHCDQIFLEWLDNWHEQQSNKAYYQQYQQQQKAKWLQRLEESLQSAQPIEVIEVLDHLVKTVRQHSWKKSLDPASSDIELAKMLCPVVLKQPALQLEQCIKDPWIQAWKILWDKVVSSKTIHDQNTKRAVLKTLHILSSVTKWAVDCLYCNGYLEEKEKKSCYRHLRQLVGGKKIRYVHGSAADEIVLTSDLTKEDINVDWPERDSIFDSLIQDSMYQQSANLEHGAQHDTALRVGSYQVLQENLMASMDAASKLPEKTASKLPEIELSFTTKHMMARPN